MSATFFLRILPMAEDVLPLQQSMRKSVNTPYRLIAVDLDGTLVRSDQSISPHTLDVLERVQELGIKVAIASGRPTYGTAHVADMLKLDIFGGYVMSYNGGEIADWKAKKVMYAQTLDKHIIPYIYTCARKHGMPIMTYVGQEVVSEVADNDYIRYSSMRNRMPIRQVDDFVAEAQKTDIVKCIIVGDPTPLHQLEVLLQDELRGKAGVFRSEPFFLEIVPLGIDKAKGLEILLHKIGLRHESLIAFGDGYNDIPMLQFAGMGVAMENAAEEIKKAADKVALSNDADGVACMVEQLLLNP